MDKEVLKQQLTRRCQRALDEALTAVDQAPDGYWIAASEWEVRDIFQKLTADCFGQMIQHRVDRLPSASQAAFSPGGPAAGGPAAQGKPRGAGVDRRRGD
jgi:hypothetical protein